MYYVLLHLHGYVTKPDMKSMQFLPYVFGY